MQAASSLPPIQLVPILDQSSTVPASARNSFWMASHCCPICVAVCVAVCVVVCVAVCCSVITVPASAGICFLNVERLLSHHWCSVCCSVLRGDDKYKIFFEAQATVVLPVLQYVLQCVLQYVLQCILQCVAVCRSMIPYARAFLPGRATVVPPALQCVLQRVAVRCKVFTDRRAFVKDVLSNLCVVAHKWMSHSQPNAFGVSFLQSQISLQTLVL